MKRFWSVASYFAVACVLVASAGCGSGSTTGMTAGTGGHAGTSGAAGSGGAGGSSAAGGGGTRRRERRRHRRHGASGTGGASAGSGGGGASGGRGGFAGTGGSAGGAGTGSGGTGGGGRGGTTGGGGTAGGGGAAGRGGTTGGGGTAGGGATGSGGTGGAIATGTIFVAPNGDDANPGTMAQPLKTVAKARDVVRGMTANMTADITVTLRGGTYQQTSTLTFGNADSGKNGFYVKYVAYQNEQPIITGGKPITGWTMSSAGNGVYSASNVTTPFRQLYVNGIESDPRAQPEPRHERRVRLQPDHRRRQHRAKHPGRGVGSGQLEQPDQGRDAHHHRLGR